MVTTGHEKMRVTVCLAARSDGTKLLPYVLVNRKRPVPKIEKEFDKKLIVNWNGSVLMDDNTTEDYLRNVIKAGGVFSGKRHVRLFFNPPVEKNSNCISLTLVSKYIYF